MSLPTTPYASDGGSGDLFSSALHHMHQADTLAGWKLPARFALTPDTNGHKFIVPELVNAVGTATNNKRFFYFEGLYNEIPCTRGRRGGGSEKLYPRPYVSTLPQRGVADANSHENYFEGLYNEFLARGGDEVEVLKSFIRALTFRRCRSVELLTPILTKIFRNPLLDAEDWEDLASIVADMNSATLLRQFVEASQMGTRQHRPCFYSHLMRFSAEQMSTPCFTLVMGIVDAINATGATWTESTMYHMLGAFCRIKDNMPYETILHIVREWRDARLHEDTDSINNDRAATKSPTTASIVVKGEHVADCPFPTSIMSRILSLCERALGADVPTAKAIMDLMGNRATWDRCISIVEASYEYAPPPEDENWTFYLVDPLSIDVKQLGEPQPSCYYIIPFSTLRAMCERAELHQETHSLYTSKLLPIRNLFREFPTHIVVTPPEVELALRAGYAELHVPASTAFANICPRCINSMAPVHSYLYGSDIAYSVHNCGLPSCIPANLSGVAQLIHLAKCAMVRIQPGRCIMVLSSNAQVIKELTPLTHRFSSTWFGICDRIIEIRTV
ncbi:Hypothetical protein, putative [Bodo saltans]|uniref:Uncharacterized protein n=1 Tax=Bodo saltans TaxID=75058 RepID=A0A0S4J7S9_BODSA|nr:Hypothetical protein, putative [Bodo saltans]|eukprot:CUG86039.1 Hypothetical protein, putative [Bodo saltans]